MTRLAIVFLRGGADGLSLLSPADDADYRRLRPTQALDPAAVHRVDDTFGLHPAARRLAGFAHAGRLAMIPACGFAGQTRSHFQAQATLEAGSEANTITGWVGRHLAATAGRTASPFRGVAVGTVSLPATFRGTSDALGTPDLSSLRLGVLRPARARQKARRVTITPAGPGLDTAAVLADWSSSPSKVAVAGANAAVAVLDRIRSSGSEHPEPEGSSGVVAAGEDEFGPGEAGSVFAAGSQVLDADLGTEVLMIDLGGWDTHNAQGTTDGRFAELVGSLDKGLGALLDRHDDLCIVVMTEFGRRVAENASGGFDHGRGSVALVLGNRVNGGVRGSWPGLAALDDGDVPAANDLRVVQAEIAETVLRTPKLDQVVPGVAGPRLDVVG
ncbi:MAG: DUF1501 domain-containing protein [Microthrixaceae bacterium]